VEIIDHIDTSKWRIVANDAVVTLDLGDFDIDVDGDFTAGALVMRVVDGEAVAAFDRPAHTGVRLLPGDYQFILAGSIPNLDITLRRHAPDTTGGFARSVGPRPAPMNDGGYMARWFDRYGFTATERRRQVTADGITVTETVYTGTLTPEGAAEIIDRHQPPLPVSAETVDPSFVPGAEITISRGGHLFNGAADLCAVVARDLTIPATFIIE
jgi:hypothetical protein